MLHEKRIVLDPRLSMIAEMVGHVKSYADIGCDHGRLGAFLLQRGWVEHAFLMDISESSLDKARALIRLLDLESRTRFIVGDGAEGLCEPVEAVVIAGMGGTTAAGIIERGREKLGDARLVLQANVAVPELRQRLSGAGYYIHDEKIVRDGRRQYVILEARCGASSYTEEELEVGPVLLREKPQALADYAAFRLRVAEKALMGAENADAQAANDLRREIRIWEDVKACL